MADVLRRLDMIQSKQPTKYPAQKGMPPADELLSPVQSEYIDWLIDPNRVGSHKEWASARGLQPTRLCEWKRTAYFERAWRERAERVLGGPERVSSVMDALYQRAVGGDTRAADIYLKQVERAAPPRRVSKDDGSLREMSDEEFNARLAAYMKGVHDGQEQQQQG